MIYDWGKFGRPRIALFNRVMSWYLICLTVLFWPFFAMMAVRDWTLIFPPLIITAATVMHRIALRVVYRAVPDQAAIARMEREIYGEPGA